MTRQHFCSGPFKMLTVAVTAILAGSEGVSGARASSGSTLTESITKGIAFNLDGGGMSVSKHSEMSAIAAALAGAAGSDPAPRTAPLSSMAINNRRGGNHGGHPSAVEEGARRAAATTKMSLSEAEAAYRSAGTSRTITSRDDSSVSTDVTASSNSTNSTNATALPKTRHGALSLPALGKGDVVSNTILITLVWILMRIIPGFNVFGSKLLCSSLVPGTNDEDDDNAGPTESVDGLAPDNIVPEGEKAKDSDSKVIDDRCEIGEAVLIEHGEKVVKHRINKRSTEMLNAAVAIGPIALLLTLIGSSLTDEVGPSMFWTGTMLSQLTVLATAGAFALYVAQGHTVNVDCSQKKVFGKSAQPVDVDDGPACRCEIQGEVFYFSEPSQRFACGEPGRLGMGMIDKDGGGIEALSAGGGGGTSAHNHGPGLPLGSPAAVAKANAAFNRVGSGAGLREGVFPHVDPVKTETKPVGVDELYVSGFAYGVRPRLAVGLTPDAAVDRRDDNSLLVPQSVNDMEGVEIVTAGGSDWEVILERVIKAHPWAAHVLAVKAAAPQNTGNITSLQAAAPQNAGNTTSLQPLIVCYNTMGHLKPGAVFRHDCSELISFTSDAEFSFLKTSGRVLVRRPANGGLGDQFVDKVDNIKKLIAG